MMGFKTNVGRVGLELSQISVSINYVKSAFTLFWFWIDGRMGGKYSAAGSWFI